MALSTVEIGDGERTFVFLHGILGRGANWRSIARRVVAARPGWKAVLVDLRLHGDSQHASPPHDLASTANDLRELPFRIDALAGHSFGGKVALQYAKDTKLDELWILDAMPGARPDRAGSEAIARVMDALRDAPRRVDKRDDFVEALGRLGLEQPIARWLATSLHRNERGFEMVTDLDAIDALLDDYFPADLWSVLDTTSAETHIVIADRSSVFTPADRARAAAIDRPNVHVHLMDAGHWLHVEKGPALIQLMTNPHENAEEES